MLRPQLILPFVALLFALPAHALPDAPTGPIRTEELQPMVKELFRKAYETRSGERKMDDVLQEYSKRANTKSTPRAQAIELYVYAQLLFVLKRQEDGMEAIKSALSIYPAFPDAHVTLGHEALSQRKFRVARKHARKARKIDSSNLQSLLLTAAVLQAEDKWLEALDKYVEAAGIDPTSPHVLQGMAGVYVQLFKDSYDAGRRKKHAAGARNIVDIWVSMEPDKAGPRIFQSQVYFELGLHAQAAEKLESTLDEVRDLRDGDRKLCLGRIFLVRVNQGDLEGAKHALSRVLKLQNLKPGERAEFEKRLADISKRGLAARFYWELERWIEVLSNTGVSAAARREAMRKVLGLLSEREFLVNPAFSEIIQTAYIACIKTLKDAPPELSIDIMRFFRRRHKDPLLLRVIVHFLYPAGAERKVTANVRVEATRTIAEVGQEAALPTLLYTLSDDSLAVCRAIDTALANITETRSPVGMSADPVTPEERKLVRIGWIKWSRSEEGAEKLARGIKSLEKSISINSKFHRAQQKNPLGDHVMTVVLLDDDMQWSVWKVAYGFLSRYFAKDFLPPELRGKKVTEELRPIVVKEATAWWNGTARTQEEADHRTAREAKTEDDEQPEDPTKKDEDE